MNEWMKTIAKLAPTVASALGGPLAGTAVAALTQLFGVETEDDLRKAVAAGKLTPEQIAKLRELEMTFQENERERGFRYEELAFKDRDSARKANVEGGMQLHVFWLGVVLLGACLITEIIVLVRGLPQGTSELVVGRVLGMMDSIAIGVFTYFYGSSKGSADKNLLMAQK